MTGRSLALLCSVCWWPQVVMAQSATDLPRSAPEAEGVSSTAVLDFIQTADAQIDTLHSVMIVRHGHVVAEGWWKPESAEKPHVLYSLSKSFTSTAVGLAVAEGKLDISAPVISFFPDEAPAEPSDNLKAMTVRDLLTMNTGHETVPKVTPETPWVRTFLHHDVPNKPGTRFLYNTPATFMCSAIVQKVTGETVLDYLMPRLFEPLAIDNPEWGTNQQGITLGGFGLHIRTQDIAKFGQLYLQRGEWNGRQLIPSDWIELATSKQVENGSNALSDWNQGYGFQFWRCRHNAFRGDGAFGQFCIVLPELNAVIVLTADTKDMQGELNIVWDKLLPAFHPGPLPENPEAAQRLAGKLVSLSVRADHIPNKLTLPR